MFLVIFGCSTLLNTYIELFCKYYLYASRELILLEKDKDLLKQ